jgi:NAD(P)-dependent dehydrogenase (short-subunit alcohol dehydrogenase family)
MRLTHTVALITGARRIGLAVGEALAERGASVAFGYARSKDEAEAGVARVEARGQRAVALQADLSDPAACRTLVGRAVDALGRLDILINMASVYQQRAFGELTVDDWDRTINVDLRAAFLCSHAAAPHMRAQGGGRIINFSDWLARSGRPRYPGFLPYYVAKTGVVALTEALALELARDNILVNAVAPGPIVAPSGTTDEDRQAVERSTPLGRWGGEQQVANVILGLLDSDFVTGETIRVDGGRHLR